MAERKREFRLAKEEEGRWAVFMSEVGEYGFCNMGALTRTYQLTGYQFASQILSHAVALSVGSDEKGQAIMADFWNWFNAGGAPDLLSADIQRLAGVKQPPL